MHFVTSPLIDVDGFFSITLVFILPLTQFIVHVNTQEKHQLRREQMGRWELLLHT